MSAHMMDLMNPRHYYQNLFQGMGLPLHFDHHRQHPCRVLQMTKMTKCALDI